MSARAICAVSALLVAAHPSAAAAKPPKANDSGAVPVAAWETMVGRDVTAVAKDGNTTAGRLEGIKDRTATIVDAGGVVRGIDIRTITELRENRPAPKPSAPPPAVSGGSASEGKSNLDKASYQGPRGTGLYVTGIALTAIGVIATVSGVITFARGRGGEDPSLVVGGQVLMGFGIPSIAIGVPLMVVGERRRDRYRAWLEQRAANNRIHVSPTLGPLRGGWGLGVRVRF